MDHLESFFLVDYVVQSRYGWKSYECEEYDEDCPICRLSLFRDPVYELPCGDVMHMSCLLEGMLVYKNGSQSACPACYTKHTVIDKECPICLDTITIDSKELPCKHVFHGKCMTEAENNGYKHCPVCTPKDTLNTPIEYADCPICLDKMDGVTIQLLCGDRFHSECIQSAKQQYGWNSCPVCFTK